MSPKHHLTKLLLAAVVITAVAAPAVAAQPQDLRGADAQGAPTAAEAQRRGYQDLRGADAQGAPTAAPVVEVSEANGFDWGDAGIGAASIFALLVAGLATTLLVVQRRGRSVGSTVAN